ncbi:MAG: hypothetical protein B6I25_04930 [Planctomycetales bacterium 4572_13]|nr:MAG: hypothetical protein B6I25_04930 [Planctomycetales bacterium 4572_13]
MRQESDKNCKSAGIKELVTVAFAEDMELAKQYQELLENNEISAKIRKQPEMAESGFSDIAIMVPEDSLDEAHVLISERARCDDFFDMVLDDQDGERFDYSDFKIKDDDDLY